MHFILAVFPQVSILVSFVEDPDAEFEPDLLPKILPNIPVILSRGEAGAEAAPEAAEAPEAEELKYDELKTQYDAIEKTKAELQAKIKEITDKIKEITDKIKNITMSPEEQANEQKYDQLKNRYDAMIITQKSLQEKIQNLVSSITSSGLFSATEV